MQQSKQLRKLFRKIATLRTERGLSQADFARLIKADVQTIKAIEKGEYELKVSMLENIAGAFKIHISDLL
ncbi:MAG: helix-turn-helix transcriptional regulator [Bacteroidia bacterium]